MLFLKRFFIVSCLLTGFAYAGNLRSVDVVSCSPGVRDYSLMWWGYGFPGHADQLKWVRCIQTGYYGFAMDVENMRILNLGLQKKTVDVSTAISKGNDLVFGLPKAALDISVTVGGKKYTCVRSWQKIADHNDYWNIQENWKYNPYRIIDSGYFMQRQDIGRLVFADADGKILNADGRLEITAWPDQLSFLLELTPKEDLTKARIAMNIKQKAMTSYNDHAKKSLPLWKAGQKESVKILLSAAKKNVVGSKDNVKITATDLKENKSLLVTLDSDRSWYYLAQGKLDWDQYNDFGRMDKTKLNIENNTSKEKNINLVVGLVFDSPIALVGGIAILCDKDGNPAGIPMQLSKNWHTDEKTRLLYEGGWFHGITTLRIPPKSSTEFQVRLVYDKWGTIPAVSHTQLCLIGWGSNQLWDEVAIGNWGESICYDPDTNLYRSMIDDMRPLMVRSFDPNMPKWYWTNNVGGGDFLVYNDAKNKLQRLTGMKTYYKSYGPNLTDVTYAGNTADGNIAARINVSTGRVDDLNRSFHRLRYDVLKPTKFKRLAFYQLGADHYNNHQFEKMAYGNRSGLIEEWPVEKGGNKYSRQAVPCDANVPWFSLHEGINNNEHGASGAWASRGLIIRSWKARLGGKDIAVPSFSVYGTTDQKVPSANVEISPPAGVDQLLPGDFVDVALEIITVPQFADDYYGYNENLRQALKTGGNTWKPVFREALSNDLAVKAHRGRVLNNYPIVVEVDNQQKAKLQITGGVGYVPITFTGLDRYTGYELFEVKDGKKVKIDQSLHGNDYWQTNHNLLSGKWSITYNISLDTPADAPVARKFVFTKSLSQ